MVMMHGHDDGHEYSHDDGHDDGHDDLYHKVKFIAGLKIYIYIDNFLMKSDAIFI